MKRLSLFHCFTVAVNESRTNIDAKDIKAPVSLYINYMHKRYNNTAKKLNHNLSLLGK